MSAGFPDEDPFLRFPFRRGPAVSSPRPTPAAAARAHAGDVPDLMALARATAPSARPQAPAVATPLGAPALQDAGAVGDERVVDERCAFGAAAPTPARPDRPRDRHSPHRPPIQMIDAVRALDLSVTPVGPSRYAVAGGREQHHVETDPYFECGCAVFTWVDDEQELPVVCKHLIAALATEGDPAALAALTAARAIATDSAQVAALAAARAATQRASRARRDERLERRRAEGRREAAHRRASSTARAHAPQQVHPAALPSTGVVRLPDPHALPARRS